jgi:predicted deacylase
MRKQVLPRWKPIFVVFTLLLLTPASAHAERNLVRPPGTTRYGAMVVKLNALLRYDQSHAHRMSLTSLGKSVQGRALWMVTLGTGAPKHVFYLCRQHGHEPASTEGALAFMSELVKADDDTPPASYLKAVTVYIVPMANPDGSEAFLRHNAHNADLNRDWLKRTQPETRALYAEISKLHPDLMTDQHELYPNDTRPDFTEVVAAGSGASPIVIAACLDAQAGVASAMQAEGFPIVSHVITDTHPARLAHRFSSIKLGIPAILFETNRLTGSGRTVADRAAAHEAFMKAVLQYAAEGRNALPPGPPAPPPSPSKGPE